MTRFGRLSILFLVVAALVLGACGDDDGGNTAASNENGAETTARGSDDTDDTSAGDDNGGGDGDDENVVELKNLKFDPDEITISTGETVRWVWEEKVLHNVTSEEGDELDSGNHDSGEFEHTFDESGTYEYVCTLHAGMEGVVEVE